MDFKYVCKDKREAFRRSKAGYVLVELVVVLVLLSLAFTFPAVSLFRAVERAQARGAAQILQGAIAKAQVDSVRLGLGRIVECSDCSVRVSQWPAPNGAVYESIQPAPIPLTNVSRWKAGEKEVRITVGAPFGAPSSAGSVYFAPNHGGVRVVVRAASGLTRREAQ